MKTIQAQWEEYFSKVYTSEVPDIQKRETRQAFFSGALAILTSTLALAELPDDEAESRLSEYHAEAQNEIRAMLRKMLPPTHKI